MCVCKSSNCVRIQERVYGSNRTHVHPFLQKTIHEVRAEDTPKADQEGDSKAFPLLTGAMFGVVMVAFGARVQALLHICRGGAVHCCSNDLTAPVGVLAGLVLSVFRLFLRTLQTTARFLHL